MGTVDVAVLLDVNLRTDETNILLAAAAVVACIGYQLGQLLFFREAWVGADGGC
jgi:hypothetical protein